MRGLGSARRILGVWAHPDDETFLSAAVMAAAVAEGAVVACVTATRGEQGSTDPDRWPAGPVLAAVRSAEMAAALGALGVTDHEWLDYPDGGCADVDPAQAVERVAAAIQRADPEVVLTFGPDGMTGHPDHRAVSGWVSAALARTGGRARLLHAIHTTEWMAAYRSIVDELDVFMGFEPPTVPVSAADVYLAAEGSLLDVKLAALYAQTSQTAVLLEHLGDDLARQVLAEEAFVEAR